MQGTRVSLPVAPTIGLFLLSTGAEFVQLRGNGVAPTQGNAYFYVMLDLVRLAGIEPTTLGFGGQYSIH